MKSAKPKPENRQGKSPAPSKQSPGFPRWTIVVLAVAGLAALLVWFNRAPEPATALAVGGPGQPDSTNVPTAIPPKPDFHRLVGKWLRPDGGYVIDITSAEDGGKLSAAYFNPQPIHVSKAEASQAGTATKVFIELRDVNYPGSTYTLTYVPEKDLLVGIYYQALQQQSFEVYFERMK